MKKMIHIIVVLVVIFFCLGFLLVIFKPSIQLPLTEETKKVTFGPYTCSDSNLTIETEFYVNKLEGVSYLRNIIVSFGAIEFRDRGFYRQEIEKKIGKTFKSDEYRDYLENTKSGVTLPSQEELMARGWRPDESGYISLVSTSKTATQLDIEKFAECFKQNRTAIYDKITDEKTGPPAQMWFDRAYLVHDLDTKA